MKKSLLIITAVTGLFLTACNQKEKQEIAKLTSERDSISALAFQKDQTINDFLSSISDIQQNLAQITEKENTISMSASSHPEMVRTSREVIQNQISDIRNLMDESKKKISDLSAKLKSSNIRMAKFEKMVASLNEQLLQKDQQITLLNEQVSSLTASVSTLETSLKDATDQNAAKAQIIQDQTTRLNTAYVAVGKYDELKNKKVITKTGGLLGIGRSTRIVPGTQSAYNKIDITQTPSVPVNAKDAKIITSHPSDSYKIEHEGSIVSQVVITDPEKFWSESKQLVIVTK
ncbi:MAG: hypothetical protein LC117_00500 [Bacteroidia bacterium]|nr:hypothetical protein [Bacteroidia bacterium]MCZ2276396.1 hypothetical protein [Bacteroidia bacterium]